MVSPIHYLNFLKSWNKRGQLENFVNRFDGMILLALVIHYLIKWPLGYDVRLTFYFDILFGVICWFLIFPPEMRTRQTFVGMLIVFSLEVFLRGLPGISDSFAHLNFTRYLLNPLFTPWWAIYATIINPGGTFFSFIFRWGLIVYLLSLLFLAMGNLPELFRSEVVGPEQEQAVLKFWDNAKKFWQNMGARVVAAYRTLKIRVQTGLTEASGGYYQGKVERNRFEPLGVYLENVKAADPEFDRTEATVILGNLKVKTLEDGINIKLSCYKGKKGSKEKVGRVNPRETTVYDLEEQPVDCTFDPYVLDAGAQPITLNAEYNFETQGYLKSYFIDKERLRTFQRRNIDVFDQFGITDKQPIAIYTNGPVKLGMSLERQPVGIDKETEPRLGITVENQPTWNGKVAELSGLIVQVPKGMYLETWKCSHPFTLRDPALCTRDHIDHKTKQYAECLRQAGIDTITDFNTLPAANDAEKLQLQNKIAGCLQQTCAAELEGYQEYELVVDPKEESLKNIEAFKTFTCWLKSDNPDELLGADPIKTLYIRAKARYRYSVEDSITVRVKETQKQTQIHTAPLFDAQKLRKIFHDYYIAEPQPLKKAFPEEFERAFPQYHEASMCTLMSLVAVTSGGDPYYLDNEGRCKGVAAVCKNVGALYPNGYFERLRSEAAAGHFTGLSPHDKIDRQLALSQSPAGTPASDIPLCDMADCVRSDTRITNTSKSFKAAVEYFTYLNLLSQRALPGAKQEHQVLAAMAAYLAGEHPENVRVITPPTGGRAYDRTSVDQSMLRVVGKKLIDLAGKIPRETDLKRPKFDISIWPPSFDIEPSNFFEWLADKIPVELRTLRITGDDLKIVDEFKNLSDSERSDKAVQLNYQLARAAKLVKQCKDQQLVRKGKPQDELNTLPTQFWVDAPVPFNIASGYFRVAPRLNSSRARIEFEYQQLPDGRMMFALYLVNITSGDEQALSTMIMDPRSIRPNTWYWRNYPFVQFRFAPSAADPSRPDISRLFIRRMQRSIVTVHNLIEDKEQEIPVWDMLKVKYYDPYFNGQNIIEVYTDKDKWPGKLCDVTWGAYPVAETCQGITSTQNQLSGLIVRNLKKEDHGMRSVATEPHGGQVLIDYTDVQFEFNPDYIEFE